MWFASLKLLKRFSSADFSMIDLLFATNVELESKEKDVMARKPEDIRASLLTKEMKIIIFIIGFITNFILVGLFLWLLKKGLPISEIRTIMFAALTIDSIFYIFSCKNLRKSLWHINILNNKFLVLSWVFAVVMLMVGVYVPVFQNLLKTVHLNFSDWVLVLGIGIINLFFIEVTKLFFINKNK